MLRSIRGRDQAFDLGVTNILQESKKPGIATNDGTFTEWRDFKPYIRNYLKTLNFAKSFFVIIGVYGIFGAKFYQRFIIRKILHKSFYRRHHG